MSDVLSLSETLGSWGLSHGFAARTIPYGFVFCNERSQRQLTGTSALVGTTSCIRSWGDESGELPGVGSWSWEEAISLPSPWSHPCGLVTWVKWVGCSPSPGVSGALKPPGFQEGLCLPTGVFSAVVSEAEDEFCWGVGFWGAP